MYILALTFVYAQGLFEQARAPPIAPHYGNFTVEVKSVILNPLRVRNIEAPSHLKVYMIAGRDLKAMDSGISSDPYLTVNGFGFRVYARIGMRAMCVLYATTSRTGDIWKQQSQD